MDKDNQIIRCLFCEEKLKPAPTTYGWVKKDRTHGICFSCIARLHRVMIAHQKASTLFRKAENDKQY